MAELQTRKHISTVGLLRRISQDELPDQVVESGSKVLKTVACDGAQLCWALWEVEHEVAKIPRGVFSEDDPAFDGGELFIDRPESVQVLVRPHELCGGAGQRTSEGRWHWPI